MDPARLLAYVERETAAFRAREPALAFSREEYARRLAVLRGGMAAAGLEVLVLTAPDAMCWLTGYASRWFRHHSSTAMPPAQCTVVHVGDGGPFMIETGYHQELARLTSCLDDVRPIPATDLSHEASLEDYVGFLVSELRREGWLGGTVGLERWSCVPPPAVNDAVEAALRDAGSQLADATTLIRAARRRKSAAEIATLERAAAAGDAGLRALAAGVRPGTTELEAAAIYQAAVAAAGGEPSAIVDTICVGPMEHGAHALNGRRQIESGETFHADATASFDRYHARCTRAFHLGEPPAELVRLVAIADGAVEVLTATARAGLPWRDLHRELRAYFADTGLPEDMCFAGGYELGVAFAPDFVGELAWSMADDTDAVIEPGTVTNLESIAYVGMVDTVVFEESGARLLSSVPREVLAVG